MTIGSATTPSINIGSTTTRTYIQSVDIIAIGQLPSTFNMPTLTMTGGGTVIGADGIGPYQAYIDLYSFNGTAQTRSARIVSNPSGLAITNYIASTPLTITGAQKIVLTASTDVSMTSTTGNINLNGKIYISSASPATPSVNQAGGTIGWNQSGGQGELDIIGYTAGGNNGGVNLYAQKTSGSITAPQLLVENPSLCKLLHWKQDYRYGSCCSRFTSVGPINKDHRSVPTIRNRGNAGHR